MREIVAGKNEGGEHEQLRTLRVSFDLAVRSPAYTPGYPYVDFEREQNRFEGLQSELFAKFHCCIRMAGNTLNFNVVVLVDRELTAIRVRISCCCA